MLKVAAFVALSMWRQTGFFLLFYLSCSEEELFTASERRPKEWDGYQILVISDICPKLLKSQQPFPILKVFEN